jgi:D-xylose transport system permease protein
MTSPTTASVMPLAPAPGLAARVDLRGIVMILALVVIGVVFSLTTGGVFLTARNLSNLIQQASITMILSVGMLLVIVGGRIDLSLGSLVGLTGGVTAMALTWMHLGAWPAIALAIALGTGMGLLQGFWVAYRGVPAFIVTLGGMMAFRGVLMGLAKGETIAVHDPLFDMLGTGYMPVAAGTIIGFCAVGAYAAVTFRKRFRRAALGLEAMPVGLDVGKVLLSAGLVGGFVTVMNSYQGVPVMTALMLAIALVVAFICTQTTFGRQIYALGGNAEAARVSGVPIERRVLALFAISGLLAGVAGVLFTARLGAGTISAGTMMELDAVAACVIGGTSLMGGIGSVGGALVGALVMAMLDNGMSLMNLESFWQYIVKGVILVLAVWVDMATKKS